MPFGQGSGGILSDHVHEMFDHSVDLGCFDFMYSKMGLGVFITKAGAGLSNKSELILCDLHAL